MANMNRNTVLKVIGFVFADPPCVSLRSGTLLGDESSASSLGRRTSILRIDHFWRGTATVPRSHSNRSSPQAFSLRRHSAGGDLLSLIVTELMADWMTPLLTQKDKDRLVGWHLGVSL
jgi:hypothetical protein